MSKKLININKAISQDSSDKFFAALKNVDGKRKQKKQTHNNN